MEYMLSYLFSDLFFTCFGHFNRQDYLSYFILKEMDNIIFRANVSDPGGSDERAGLRSIFRKTRLQWERLEIKMIDLIEIILEEKGNLEMPNQEKGR